MDSSLDPIFLMQFLARLSIQYDLADLAAMLLTPCLVSAFAWRDGHFALQGTGVLVRPCDLPNVWTRFAVLLLIRPFFSYLARLLLDRSMGRTMICLPTVFGPSPLGLEIYHAATALNMTSRAAFDHLINSKLRDVRVALNLDDAEFRVVRDELCLRNLDYRQCSCEMLRRNYRFYTAVILFSLFAAFPVRRTLPSELARGHWPADVRSNGTATAIAASSAHWANSSTAHVPHQLTWMYVPSHVVAADDIHEFGVALEQPCI